MEKKQYNKTWYYKITLTNKMSPDNWISGKPIRIFGRMIAVLWKIAKPNYPWEKV